MAKKFVDIALTDTRSALVIQDGTALTLTNKVRILWDDTLQKVDRDTLIIKALEAIRQQTA